MAAQVHGASQSQMAANVNASAQSKTRKVKPKKPHHCREFQDRFVDNPDFIHKGEILEFETAQNSSAKKKMYSEQQRLFDLGMNDKNYRDRSVQKGQSQARK